MDDTYEKPETDLRFDKLGRSVHSAYRGWQSFRTLNDNLVQSYLGPSYGETEDKRKCYLNKLRQCVTAYMMLLAANRPRVEISTNYKHLRAFAKHFETAMNNLIVEIGLEYTIRRWVLDAFFQVGIVKLHMKDSGLVELEPNLWMDPGTPFVSNVSLDDFACDVTARQPGEMKWAADMYRIPFSLIEEGVKIGMYDPAVAATLQPSSKYETADGERLERFSQGDECDMDEFEPMIDLCDVWVARDDRIYTFPITDRRNFSFKPTPLAWMEWDDPDHGPYHILGFDEAPENIMPLSPAADLDEMHRLINNLMRKSARQAIRQKDMIVYTPEGAKTAKNVQQGDDGSMIEGDPQTIMPVKFGGVDAQNQAFLTGALDLWNNIAGNPDQLLGLGAQAETLGQEEIIAASSNRKIGQMQYRVMDATRQLLRGAGLMLWSDEFKEMAATTQVAEGIEVDSTWTAGDREGAFENYNFSVDIFSMTYRPPGAQAQQLIQLLQGVYTPMMEPFVGQGGNIDFQALTEHLSKMTGLTCLDEIVTFSNPTPTDDPAPSSDVKGSSSPNGGTYTRISKSAGNTTSGMAQAKQMAWLGAANQGQANQAGMQP